MFNAVHSIHTKTFRLKCLLGCARGGVGRAKLRVRRLLEGHRDPVRPRQGLRLHQALLLRRVSHRRPVRHSIQDRLQLELPELQGEVMLG